MLTECMVGIPKGEKVRFAPGRIDGIYLMQAYQSHFVRFLVLSKSSIAKSSIIYELSNFLKSATYHSPSISKLDSPSLCRLYFFAIALIQSQLNPSRFIHRTLLHTGLSCCRNSFRVSLSNSVCKIFSSEKSTTVIPQNVCKSTRVSSGFMPGSEPGINVTYLELVTVRVGRRRMPPAMDALLGRRSVG